MIFRMLRSSVFILVLYGLMTGCSDPTKGKPEATITEAFPVDAVEYSDPAGGADATEGESFPSMEAGGELKTTYVLTDDCYIGFEGSKPLGQHYGQFLSYEGTVTVEGGDLLTTKIDVTMDTTTTETDDTRLTAVLKNEYFFNAAAYPKARFTSTRVTRSGSGFEVEGNLTIRGITKGVTFPAEITLKGDVITAMAEFAIDRNEWEIGKGYTGQTLIYDDILIDLEIEAKAAR